MKKIILILLFTTGISYSQTDLTAISVMASYGGFLHFGNNTGVSSTLQPVYDGLGNLLPFQISTNEILVQGILAGQRSAQISRSANYNVMVTDRYIDCTAGVAGITITLPNAVGNSGATFVITKVDNGAGGITIATTSLQTINGSQTYLITAQWLSYTVHSDGLNWIIN